MAIFQWKHEDVIRVCWIWADETHFSLGNFFWRRGQLIASKACAMLCAKPLPMMCQWLSALAMASGLSQEDFPLARAAGRDWVFPRRAGMAPLQLGQRPPRIPAIQRHCLHSQRGAKRVAVKCDQTHTPTHTPSSGGTWKEWSDHRTPSNPRPHLGPKRTIEKQSVHSFRAFCWHRFPGMEHGLGKEREDQPQSLMCHYKHKHRLLALPGDVEPHSVGPFSREWRSRCKL